MSSANNNNNLINLNLNNNNNNNLNLISSLFKKSDAQNLGKKNKNFNKK